MNTVLHPSLAEMISRCINKRSVAGDMIDVTLRAKPYQHDAFLFWVREHRTASNALMAMGIDVITYDEEKAR